MPPSYSVKNRGEVKQRNVVSINPSHTTIAILSSIFHEWSQKTPSLHLLLARFREERWHEMGKDVREQIWGKPNCDSHWLHPWRCPYYVWASIRSMSLTSHLALGVAIFKFKDQPLIMSSIGNNYLFDGGRKWFFEEMWNLYYLCPLILHRQGISTREEGTQSCGCQCSFGLSFDS